MKRVLKLLLRPIWRISAPLRSEADRRIELWFTRAIEPKARRYAAEFTPGIDGLLRELVRLQERVDELQAAVDALSVADASAGRAKAG